MKRLLLITSLLVLTTGIAAADHDGEESFSAGCAAPEEDTSSSEGAGCVTDEQAATNLSTLGVFAAVGFALSRRRTA